MSADLYIPSFPRTFRNCVVVEVINILFADPTRICELRQFEPPDTIHSPVVPQEEPLARLLHVGLAVGGEDLRHLGLDLTQRDLQACLSTVPQPEDEFVVSWKRIV